MSQPQRNESEFARTLLNQAEIVEDVAEVLRAWGKQIEAKKSPEPNPATGQAAFPATSDKHIDQTDRQATRELFALVAQHAPLLRRLLVERGCKAHIRPMLTGMLDLAADVPRGRDMGGYWSRARDYAGEHLWNGEMLSVPNEVENWARQLRAEAAAGARGAPDPVGCGPAAAPSLGAAGPADIARIPAWAREIAASVGALVRRHNARCRFREKLHLWKQQHDAQDRAKEEWEARRQAHFDSLARLNPDDPRRAELAGPPGKGWLYQGHTVGASGQSPGEPLFGWVPPDLVSDASPQVRKILRLLSPSSYHASEALSLAEKYTLLAAIHDRIMVGCNPISPWRWPAALNDQTMPRAKEAAPFDMGLVEQLFPDPDDPVDSDHYPLLYAEPQVRSFLADVEADLGGMAHPTEVSAGMAGLPSTTVQLADIDVLLADFRRVAEPPQPAPLIRKKKLWRQAINEAWEAERKHAEKCALACSLSTPAAGSSGPMDDLKKRMAIRAEMEKAGEPSTAGLSDRFRHMPEKVYRRLDPAYAKDEAQAKRKIAAEIAECRQRLDLLLVSIKMPLLRLSEMAATTSAERAWDAYQAAAHQSKPAAATAVIQDLNRVKAKLERQAKEPALTGTAGHSGDPAEPGRMVLHAGPDGLRATSMFPPDELDELSELAERARKEVPPWRKITEGYFKGRSDYPLPQTVMNWIKGPVKAFMEHLADCPVAWEYVFPRLGHPYPAFVVLDGPPPPRQNGDDPAIGSETASKYKPRLLRKASWRDALFAADLLASWARWSEHKLYSMWQAERGEMDALRYQVNEFSGEVVTVLTEALAQFGPMSEFVTVVAPAARTAAAQRRIEAAKESRDRRSGSRRPAEDAAAGARQKTPRLSRPLLKTSAIRDKMLDELSKDGKHREAYSLVYEHWDRPHEEILRTIEAQTRVKTRDVSNISRMKKRMVDWHEKQRPQAAPSGQDALVDGIMVQLHSLYRKKGLGDEQHWTQLAGTPEQPGEVRSEVIVSLVEYEGDGHRALAAGRRVIDKGRVEQRHIDRTHDGDGQPVSQDE